jgi:hypothetical protein
MTNTAALTSFPRAFIIRPFGEKAIGLDGAKINFQRGEDELIRPAMQRADLVGATTGVDLHAGLLRDMFQRVTAQLVIADISIHNANVRDVLGCTAKALDLTWRRTAEISGGRVRACQSDRERGLHLPSDTIRASVALQSPGRRVPRQSTLSARVPQQCCHDCPGPRTLAPDAAAAR